MQNEDLVGGVEVAPSAPEPKNCAACGRIFVPKWWKARRCDTCRQMKVPVRGEEINNLPFN